MMDIWMILGAAVLGGMLLFAALAAVSAVRVRLGASVEAVPCGAALRWLTQSQQEIAPVAGRMLPKYEPPQTLESTAVAASAGTSISVPTVATAATTALAAAASDETLQTFMQSMFESTRDDSHPHDCGSFEADSLCGVYLNFNGHDFDVGCDDGTGIRID